MSSAESKTAFFKVSLSPPTTRIFPEGRRVAVWPALASRSGAILMSDESLGSKSSIEFKTPDVAFAPPCRPY